MEEIRSSRIEPLDLKTHCLLCSLGWQVLRPNTAHLSGFLILPMVGSLVRLIVSGVGRLLRLELNLLDEDPFPGPQSVGLGSSSSQRTHPFIMRSCPLAAQAGSGLH